MKQSIFAECLYIFTEYVISKGYQHHLKSTYKLIEKIQHFNKICTKYIGNSPNTHTHSYIHTHTHTNVWKQKNVTDNQGKKKEIVRQIYLLSTQ